MVTTRQRGKLAGQGSKKRPKITARKAKARQALEESINHSSSDDNSDDDNSHVSSPKTNLPISKGDISIDEENYSSEESVRQCSHLAMHQKILD